MCAVLVALEVWGEGESISDSVQTASRTHFNTSNTSGRLLSYYVSILNVNDFFVCFRPTISRARVSWEKPRTGSMEWHLLQVQIQIKSSVTTAFFLLRVSPAFDIYPRRNRRPFRPLRLSLAGLVPKFTTMKFV